MKNDIGYVPAGMGYMVLGGAIALGVTAAYNFFKGSKFRERVTASKNEAESEEGFSVGIVDRLDEDEVDLLLDDDDDEI